VLVVEAKGKTPFIGALLDDVIGLAGLLAEYIAATATTREACTHASRW